MYAHAFLNGDSEWTEDGELWVQYVSAVPSTRQDAISLGVGYLFQKWFVTWWPSNPRAPNLAEEAQ